MLGAFVPAASGVAGQPVRGWHGVEAWHGLSLQVATDPVLATFPESWQSKFALHVGNGLLVYVLGLLLFRAAIGRSRETRTSAGVHIGALAAALLFVVHPLRVEALSWGSPGELLVSACFLLLSTLTYLRGARPARRLPWLIVSLACYAASLAAAPLGIALPLVLLVIDWYPLGRLGGPSGRWFGSARRAIWLEKLPYLILATGAVVLGPGLGSGLHLPPSATSVQPSLLECAAQAAYGLVFYAWKTVWPRDLVPLYECRLPLKIVSAQYLGALIVVLVAAGALVWYRRRVPAVVAAGLCYALLVIPIPWLARDGAAEVADRYSYMPSVALALLAGGGVSRLWMPRRRALRAVAGAVIVLGLLIAGGLGVLARQQGRVWESPTTLWTHAYEHGPRRGIAQYMLARQRNEAGQTERAVQLYREAIALRPALLEAHFALSATLVTLDQTAEAIETCRRAVRSAPQNAAAHFHLGVALAAGGELAAAEEQLRHAITLGPGNADPQKALGHLLMSQGKYDEAAAAFGTAVKSDPDDADSHYDLGRALESADRPQPARAAFEAALAADPDHKLARQALEALSGGAP